MKKKILFVVGDLYPNLYANSEIAYRLAKALNENNNCNISIVGVNRSGRNNSNYNPFGFQTYSILPISDYYKITTKKNKFARIIQCLRFPLGALYFAWIKLKKPKDSINFYYNKLKHILKSEDFDAIICFTRPFDTIRAISKLNPNIPIISYKLDLWHSASPKNDKLLSEELFVEKNTDIIFTPPNAYSAYCSLAEQNKITKKIYSLEFPNIIFREKPKKSLFNNSDKIHCVYAGSLYKGRRSPEFAIQLFRELESVNIEFHIFGRQFGSCINEDKLPKNVVYHGSVSSEEAILFMQSADILVHIGNRDEIFFPSKILTYISLGKPIINIIQHSKCPTLPYIEKYPLAKTILQSQPLDSKTIIDVRNFCLDNCKKSIPFETVKELYPTCTSEYVSQKVYDTIFAD